MGDWRCYYTYIEPILGGGRRDVRCDDVMNAECQRSQKKSIGDIVRPRIIKTLSGMHKFYSYYDHSRTPVS